MPIIPSCGIALYPNPEKPAAATYEDAIKNALNPQAVTVDTAMGGILSALMFQIKNADSKQETDICKKAKGEAEAKFKSKKLLDSHYDKHKGEFGNISKDEYLKKANDLINSTGDDVLTKVRKNGDTLYYNKATNEFAVKTKDGFLRTFFKPSDGFEYFNRQ